MSRAVSVSSATTRQNELWALTWADVDLNARTITVSKEIDSETGEVKSPKSDAGRRKIPIHDHLFPLLQATTGRKSALVIGSFKPSEDHIGQKLRDGLAEAGIRSTASDRRQRHRGVGGLPLVRDTHATWAALAGGADRGITRRMGHEKSGETTGRYIKVAETFATQNVRVRFPVLPAELWANFGPTRFQLYGRTKRKNLRVTRGFLIVSSSCAGAMGGLCTAVLMGFERRLVG